MPYLTVPAQPIFHQFSLTDLLDDAFDPGQLDPVRNAPSSTRTIYQPSFSDKVLEKFDVMKIVTSLLNLTQKYQHLYEGDRHQWYAHFEIPKQKIDPNTGRPEMRPIDAPHSDLKLALYELRDILEQASLATYHTNAFAYVRNRCAVDSIRRHQANQSWWFLKTDFSNFFGSTTPDFVRYQLSMILPFSEVYRLGYGSIIDKALDLCFLDGGLPQGTPISPMLTNLMMIPIDHRLSNTLRKKDNVHYVYTRYADDILISSKVKFDYRGMERYLNDVLHEFRAPFKIKETKTRFGSRNGHNFNLGVILNANNEITIGYKRKMSFRALLNEYIQRKTRHDAIPLQEIQMLDGLLGYYSSIEPAYWENVLARLNEKNHVNLRQMIRNDLKGDEWSD